MEKPVAAVVYEGTLADQVDTQLLHLGVLRPDAKAKLAKLQETHQVLIVSGLARSSVGARSLTSYLTSEAVPFDDIWVGWGFPESAVRYDDAAVKL